MSRKQKCLILLTGLILIIGISVYLYYSLRPERRVVYCKIPVRPLILDRDGAVLIGNKKTAKNRERRRFATQDGKFAAIAIGYTSIDNGDCEIGLTGIEKYLEYEPSELEAVYLAVDTKLQLNIEKLMEQIFQRCKPEYVYASVIRGNGEIVAIAQRPVIDINDRSQVPPYATVNFNSGFRIPVTDELMRLLGSSSAAPIEEKVKLDLVDDLNIFPYDVSGKIIGQRQLPETDDDVIAAGQATTSLHYLRSYASKKTGSKLSKLQFFSYDDTFSELDKTVYLKWDVISRTQSELRLTAVGEISLQNGEKLYILVHSAHKTKDSVEVAEKILQTWNIK